MEDMLHGRSLARQSNGIFQLISYKIVLAITHTKLNELAQQMKWENEYLKEDIDFIQSVPHL
jgi:hypothetical protein